MVAFGRVRERFGKTVGERTSNESLDDKWMKWVNLMRQMSTTSLGDDACETLTDSRLGEGEGTNVDSSTTQPHADGYQRCGVNVCLLWPEWP